MFWYAIVILFLALFWCRPAQAAQPVPQLELVAHLPGVKSISVCGKVTGPADPVSVYLFVGTMDGGTNAAGWEYSISQVYQLPGEFSLSAAVLMPGAQYCFRVYAENGGGGTWSKPVYFRTQDLYRIEKQIGTVVSVK